MVNNRASVIRVGIVAGVAVALHLFLNKAYQHVVQTYDNARSAPIVLKPTEKAKTVVQANKVITATRRTDGKVDVVQRYVPPEGKVEVIVPVGGGEQIVKVKDKGLTLSPGGGFGLVGVHPGAFVFVKFAYWRRIGLCGGVGINSASEFVPYGGVSYHLISNTFLHVGVGAELKTIAGIAVKF